jgi:hypothetical protein
MNASTRPTQIDTIKTDLLNGCRVDSVTAFSRHFITRLASIVNRLRTRGWPIATARDKGNGLARYSLPQDWNPDMKKPR